MTERAEVFAERSPEERDKLCRMVASGAGQGDCFYLIRPDGYVAYRSRPARLPDLQGYLDRVF